MKPGRDADRAARFTRRCIPVAADFELDGEAFVRGDEAWWVDEARTCVVCERLFVLTEGMGPRPKTCSPACWIEKRRRDARRYLRSAA